METNGQKRVFLVGMDLGTFKTAVASSMGARDVVYSAVGWPRDLVGRSLLGRELVFGQDTVDQRLALNVVRPFEKGMLKYSEASDKKGQIEVQKRKEAARLLVEHAVSLTKPPRGMPIYGVIGAPARASVANKKIILEAVRPHRSTQS